jgi:hypothetical protein
MPLTADDRRLDHTKFFQMYMRLAMTQHGTVCNAYSYHAVKRLVAVDGDDIEAAAVEDPLASRIVAGIKALPDATRANEQSVDPPASLAALFQEHELARALKPKLYVALDVRTADARVCGMLTACDFVRDDALSTSRLTADYCSEHGLPRFDKDWLLVDVVASAKPGTGALLLLQCVVAALRARKRGVVAIAVTTGGRGLMRSFGFDTTRSFRANGGTRHVAHLHLSALRFADVHRRLRVHESLLATCVRGGYTARTAHTLVTRC